MDHLSKASFPRGYHWFREKNLAGYAPFSRLEPWYFLPDDQIFSVSQRWPKDTDLEDIVAFARRQDNDDIACFYNKKKQTEKKVLLIHGWTEDGYNISGQHEDYWEWIKTVFDDIKIWLD